MFRLFLNGGFFLSYCLKLIGKPCRCSYGEFTRGSTAASSLSLSLLLIEKRFIYGFCDLYCSVDGLVSSSSNQTWIRTSVVFRKKRITASQMTARIPQLKVRNSRRFSQWLKNCQKKREHDFWRQNSNISGPSLKMYNF